MIHRFKNPYALLTAAVESFDPCQLKWQQDAARRRMIYEAFHVHQWN